MKLWTDATGGSFNLADNAVDRWVRRGRGDRPALVWEREDGSRGTRSTSSPRGRSMPR